MFKVLSEARSVPVHICVGHGRLNEVNGLNLSDSASASVKQTLQMGLVGLRCAVAPSAVWLLTKVNHTFFTTWASVAEHSCHPSPCLLFIAVKPCFENQLLNSSGVSQPAACCHPHGKHWVQREPVLGDGSISVTCSLTLASIFSSVPSASNTVC